MSGDKRLMARRGGRVAFVAGCRTPFARAGGMLADLTALDLARGVATGARITLSLLKELRRRGGRFGLLGLCAAEALGFSMVVETE